MPSLVAFVLQSLFARDRRPVPRRPTLSGPERLEQRLQPSVNTWIAPGGGSWATAGNWSQNRVPVAEDHVVIPDLPGAQTITFNTTATVASIECAENLDLVGGSLTVDTTAEVAGQFLLGGTLVGATIPSGTTVTARGGKLDGVTVAGEVALSAGWDVFVSGNLTLDGGTVRVGDDAASSEVRFVGASPSVAGSGTFLLGGTSATGTGRSGLWLWSSGSTLTVAADVTVRGKYGFAGAFHTNSDVEFRGALVAEGGGYVSMEGTWTGQAAGVGSVTAEAGSSVVLAGTYEGGVLSPTGTFRLTGTISGATIPDGVVVRAEGGRFHDVTLAGTAVLSAGWDLFASGTLTLDEGDVYVGDDASSSQVRFDGLSPEVVGTGTFHLGGTTATGTGRSGLWLWSSGSTLNVAAGVVVRGRYGFVGPFYTNSTLAFAGTLIAEGGGYVSMEGDWTGQAAGVGAIVAEAGSSVILAGTYEGGVLAPAGTFRLSGAVSGATIPAGVVIRAEGGRLADVTLAGEVVLSDGWDLFSSGTLTLAGGVLRVGDDASSSEVRFDGTLPRVEGGGTIFLNGTAPTGTGRSGLWLWSSATTLNVAAGVTVRGRYGFVGAFYTGGRVAFDGSLVAEGDGVLSMEGHWTGRPAGVGAISAAAGSSVVLAGVYEGGVLAPAGTFRLGGTLKDATVPAGVVVRAEGGTLDGVTLGGEVSLSAGWDVFASGTLTLAGGVLRVGDDASSSEVRFVGASPSVVGTGTFYLNGTSATGTGRSGLWLWSSGSTLTVAADVTVRGKYGFAGAFHTNSDVTFGGTLVAEGAGAVVSLEGRVATTGVFRAAGGASLLLPETPLSLDGSNTLTAGTYRADAGGSLVWRSSSSIVAIGASVSLGGDLAKFIRTAGTPALSSLAAVTAAGSLELLDASALAIPSLANAGRVVLGPRSTLALAGDFSQAATGTLRVGIGGVPATGRFGRVEASGTASLGGTLEVFAAGGYEINSADAYAVVAHAGASGAFAATGPGVVGVTYSPAVTTVRAGTFLGNPPVAVVSPMTLSLSPTFAVSWTGTGGRGGIASYDVFVSVNNGAYSRWLANTTLTSATYAGTAGTVYRFYALATDAFGTVQTSPPEVRTVRVVAATNVGIRKGGTAAVVYNAVGGAVLHSQPLSSAEPLVIAGGSAQAETVQITFASGAFAPAGGVRIDLGTGVGDRVLVNGANTASAVFAAGTRPRLTLAGAAYDFTGVDAFRVAAVGSVAVQTSAGNQAFTADTVVAGESRLWGAGLPALSVAGVRTLTVFLGTGDAATAANSLTVNGPWSAAGLANVTVVGGAGADSLRHNAASVALPVAGGVYRFDAGTGADALSASGNVGWTLSATGLSTGGRSLFHTGVERGTLVGGAGNNLLDARAFAGSVVLVGGGGDDTLYGTNGRDILIGGAGRDTLAGIGGDDLLVAGSTAFDALPAALDALMAEWSRTDNTPAARVANLRNGTGLNGGYRLTSATVPTEAEVDSLFGGVGTDWFWGRLSADLFKDRVAAELVN